MSEVGKVDYVKFIADAMKAKAHAEEIIDASMENLYVIAMNEVREAFNRVFINEIRFPEVKT
jgi:hypothetical protein